MKHCDIQWEAAQMENVSRVQKHAQAHKRLSVQTGIVTAANKKEPTHIII